jgi:putative ABC transport system permease protein
MESMLQDVKYSLRQLGRQPSFTILAGLTLALGIGVSTALFSVIDAALLRPLPYASPEQLVTLLVEDPNEGRPGQYAPSMDDIRSWRALETVVSRAGVGRVAGARLIVDSGTPERLVVAEASDDFLETYGITPILGRGIHADDTRRGAEPVALLAHGYWRQQFGADPGVLGRKITIENRPVTIIGVLPPGFYAESAIWQAIQFSAATANMRGSGTPAIARLRPGVTLEQARAAFNAVMPVGFMGGSSPVRGRVVMQSMYDDETGSYGPMILTLSMSVGLILLIACVNVAGLTLARGATRDVELAIRAAVGADRGQLVRQLFTESVLLAVAGALVGMVLAYASLDSLVALIPLSLPANSPVTINATVLAFALSLAMMTALLSGLVPALKLSRAPRALGTMFNVAGRGGAPLSKSAGQWLIGVEVALALVLMTGAGLMLRSFARLVSVDLGYNADNVLTLEVEPLDRAPAMRREYYTSLTAAMRQMPEVISAGAIDQTGLSGGGFYTSVSTDLGNRVAGPQRTVLPGYFESVGVTPIAGRLLEDADRVTSDAVVVSESFARFYFGGHALGHTLRIGDAKNQRSLRIVGMVPDIKHRGPQGRHESQMYMLPDPNANPALRMRLAIVMRIRDGASLSIERLKEIAESLGPRVLVGEARPAAAFISQLVATPRQRMLLLTLLGVFGLLLTLIGIFSMTAYAVARRTREIGVRVAVGARPSQVVAAMIGGAVPPVIFGLAAGMAGTYYATRIITRFLFQTDPGDPATLAGVVALVGAAACLAAWLPARRAASIDPVAALRAE